MKRDRVAYSYEKVEFLKDLIDGLTSLSRNPSAASLRRVNSITIHEKNYREVVSNPKYQSLTWQIDSPGTNNLDNEQEEQEEEEMELRFRRGIDVENGSSYIGNGHDLHIRNVELETLLANFKNLLDQSRHREKKLLKVLEESGIEHHIDFTIDDEAELMHQDPSFLRGVIDRSGWLIGLLIFQSMSSFILRYNEALLQSHPVIVYFLTMLVGAGGNAGNQATVRAIRGIALGTLTEATMIPFIIKEVCTGFALSLILGVFGMIRVTVLASTSMTEAFAISIALSTIVFTSVCLGALLPIFFHKIGIDSAHSSTTIQVIMDILGVIITCTVSTKLLDGLLNQYIS